MDTSTRRLRAFLMVADTGSFTVAAHRLHLTQQAVSLAVRRLEDELGITLLERSTRSVLLTPAGQAFAAQVRLPLGQLDEAGRTVRRIARQEAGELRIGAMAGAALELTDPILDAMRAAHPEVTLTVEHHLYDDPTAGLRDGTTDVAFLRPPIEGRGLVSHALFVEPRVAVVSVRHRLARRESIVAADLADEIITRPDGPDDRWNGFWALGRGRDRCVSTRTLEVALEQVASSRCVSIAALGWVRFYPRKGLVAVPISDIAGSTLTVSRLSTERHERVRAFIRIARSVAEAQRSLVPEATT